MRITFFALLSIAVTSCIINGCTKTDNGNSTTITVVPLSPSTLTGSVTSFKAITLNWTDNSTNEDGFKIERKENGAAYSLIATTLANITTYIDSSVLSGATYTYRVYAYNKAGNSLTYTNEITLVALSLPQITTTAISDTTAISAISGGTITNDGGSAITARGVVWSTTPNPTVALSTKTLDSTGTGSFISSVTGLDPNTKYYIKAYATNSTGTAYGNEISFLTNNVNLKNGLVAYFPFDGNAGDSSMNGNDATVHGATLTTDRFGNLNQAYSFDGISNYIEAPNSASLNPTDITISFWMLCIDSNRCVIEKSNKADASNFGYSVTYKDEFQGWKGLATTYGIGQCNSSNAITSWSPQHAFDGDQWKMITVTIQSNGLISQYLNGNLVYQHQNSQNFIPCNNSSSTLRIGGPHWSGDPEWYVGKLDEVRIYNRILTPSEISYLAVH